MVMYPTRWRVGDLKVGMVIYNPPMKVIDPKTWQATEELARFLVVSNTDGNLVLQSYHGDLPAVMPPENRDDRDV